MTSTDDVGLTGNAQDVDEDDTARDPPSDAQPSKLSNVAKRRRYAKLERLEAEGSYFSMESMRFRDPILYALYIGDKGTTEPSAKGQTRLSDFLLQVAEREAHLKRLGEARQEMAKAIAARSPASNTPAADGLRTQSAVDAVPTPQALNEDDDDGLGDCSRPEAIETFTRLMRERFLDGRDHQYVDYDLIDSDIELDDRWAREIALDAEERYFDAD